jgi:hypothetical protein
MSIQNIHETVLFKTLSEIPGFYIYVFKDYFDNDKIIHDRLGFEKRILPYSELEYWSALNHRILTRGTILDDVSGKIYDRIHLSFAYSDNIYFTFSYCQKKWSFERREIGIFGNRAISSSMDDIDIITSGNILCITKFMFGDEGIKIGEDIIRKDMISRACQKCAMKIYLFKDTNLCLPIMHHILSLLLELEGFPKLELKIVH